MGVFGPPFIPLKDGPVKFDIRRPTPRPRVADLRKCRIQITQNGAGKIRHEKAEDEPPLVAIFLAKSGRNLAAPNP